MGSALSPTQTRSGRAQRSAPRLLPREPPPGTSAPALPAHLQASAVAGLGPGRGSAGPGRPYRRGLPPGAASPRAPPHQPATQRFRLHPAASARILASLPQLCPGPGVLSARLPEGLRPARRQLQGPTPHRHLTAHLKAVPPQLLPHFPPGLQAGVWGPPGQGTRKLSPTSRPRLPLPSRRSRSRPALAAGTGTAFKKDRHKPQALFSPQPPLPLGAHSHPERAVTVQPSGRVRGPQPLSQCKPCTLAAGSTAL